MTDEVERTYFEQDKTYMHHIGELPSYSGMNYAIAEQDRIFEYEQDDTDDSVEGVVLEEANENDTEDENIDSYKTYSGMITELEPNQVFVFGSNTQGKHGKGAALMARQKFGAVYGQAEGPQGQSYGIITKDLTSSIQPSRTKEQIVEQIEKLYEYARKNKDKEFLIAYSGTGTNLNYYSNEQMAEMFAIAPIPGNIVFEEEFSKLVFSSVDKEIDKMFNGFNSQELSLQQRELTGVDLMALYDQGNKRISEVLDTLEDLTSDERQTYLNEFAQQMARDNVNTQDKLEEALRKFICNL